LGRWEQWQQPCMDEAVFRQWAMHGIQISTWYVCCRFSTQYYMKKSDLTGLGPEQARERGKARARCWAKAQAQGRVRQMEMGRQKEKAKARLEVWCWEREAWEGSQP